MTTTAAHDMTVSRYTDDGGMVWYGLSMQGTPVMPPQRDKARVLAEVSRRLEAYRLRYGRTYETLVMPTVELWDGDKGELLPYDSATL